MCHRDEHALLAHLASGPARATPKKNSFENMPKGWVAVLGFLLIAVGGANGAEMEEVGHAAEAPQGAAEMFADRPSTRDHAPQPTREWGAAAFVRESFFAAAVCMTLFLGFTAIYIFFVALEKPAESSHQSYDGTEEDVIFATSSLASLSGLRQPTST